MIFKAVCINQVIQYKETILVVCKNSSDTGFITYIIYILRILDNNTREQNILLTEITTNTRLTNDIQNNHECQIKKSQRKNAICKRNN